MWWVYHHVNFCSFSLLERTYKKKKKKKLKKWGGPSRPSRPACDGLAVVAHSHLEGTYMLLFDPATLPLWSTIKRYTFSADVAEWLTFTLKQGQSKLTVGSRTRLLEDLWRSSVTPLWKRWRLSTGVGTCWKCAPQPHRSFAVRRAMVPAG